MIAGSLSFHTDTTECRFNAEILRGESDEELMFKPVVTGTFNGGCLLHSRLPYNDADFYHFDESSDLIVLFSGAIYNADPIKQEKNLPATLTAPALTASLFLNEGPGFVESLNGDFAIFLYRPRQKEAFLFRDHVGIRPLAWSLRNRELIFASDIIGLCKALSDGQSAPAQYLSGYFKYTDRRVTPNPEVRKLLPGHYLRITEKGTKLVQYWHPEAVRVNRALSFGTMISDLDELLHDSVKIRCDNRFRAGAHVSSGLDSGVVSTLAREQYAKQELFFGFSWTPRDFNPGKVAYDERALVTLTCEKAGIDPIFSDIVAEDFVLSLSSLYGNPSLLYEGATMASAVQTGTNLIFSGWGGDEFISSGDRGVDQDLLRNFKLRTFFRRNSLLKFKRFIRNQFRWVLFPALGILDSGTGRAFRDDARYLKREYRMSERRALANFYFHRSRRQLHLNMLRFYHLQKRCEEWMINGYRRGVEYRYPLLDRRIIEYMLSVPSELLCMTNLSRPVMRELGKGILPEEARLNTSKADPVSLAYTWKMYRDAALMVAGEVDKWRGNPGLGFIDIDLLMQDLNEFRADPAATDNRVLFKGIVYIKAVHEFSRRY